MKKLTSGEAAEVFEPDADMLAHFNDFDSFEDRLIEAEADYQTMVAVYEDTDPNTDELMKAAKDVELAAKTLIKRALTIFHIPGAAQSDKEAALAILDRMSKDANKRERTCSALWHKKFKGTMNDYLRKLFRAKQERMEFTNRCMRTQSVYIKRLLKDPEYVDPEMMLETRAAIEGERVREAVPDGCYYCPPRIFPHDPIPQGEPVPSAPEVFRRVKEMEPDHMVFDKEHQLFVIEPGYVSEDGLIDDQSIVWDHENHKVTMKYRGGVPVTWDFVQHLDPRDVPRPEDWYAQYYVRLYDQHYWESYPGLFRKGGK